MSPDRLLHALGRGALALALCFACGDDSMPSSATTTMATTTSETTTAASTSTTTATPSTGTDTTDAASDETGGSSSSGGMVEPSWRSELYPEDWTPAHTGEDGRFLHDFSYAGYHNGEAEPGQELPATEIDVVAEHGADPSGTSDSTAAIQAALDTAALAGGAIVSLPPGLYRIDGQLAATASRTVIRGAGADQSRLWFTAFTGMSFGAHLTFGAAPQLGADVALVEDAPARTPTIAVADASAFAVGDDIAVGWVITPEFVAEHGMDGTWVTFNGQWQAFFWRTVRAVDPAASTIELDVPLRYPALLRDAASVRPVTGLLREVAIEELGIANAVGWDDAWSQDQVYAIAMIGVKDAWFRGVRSFVSPGAPREGPGSLRHLQSGGITVRQSKRVTLDDVTLEFAQHRGEGGNGYLYEIMQSSEVLVRDCVGRAGRHNFIQNWGFGTTGVVWLRMHSSEGKAVALQLGELGTPGLSEFHHSLATANLVDQSVVDDGWGAVNRGAYSSGAGHSATQSVVWNTSGTGVVRSRQFGHGYVIGAAAELQVETSLVGLDAAGTEPEDWVEGPGELGALEPASLYEDQLARRLGG
jgi:Pectate lyase superfamily protein